MVPWEEGFSGDFRHADRGNALWQAEFSPSTWNWEILILYIYGNWLNHDYFSSPPCVNCLMDVILLPV